MYKNVSCRGWAAYGWVVFAVVAGVMFTTRAGVSGEAGQEAIAKQGDAKNGAVAEADLAEDAPTGVVFQDGFESGDMSKTNGDGFAWGKNNCTSVVTTEKVVWNNRNLDKPVPEGSDWKPKTGMHCLRFHYGPGHHWTEQRFNLGKAYREIWIRYWLRVPVNYNHEKNEKKPSNGKFFALWMDGYEKKGDGPTVIWATWPTLKDEGSTDETVSYGKGGHTECGGHRQRNVRFINVPGDRGRWMQVVYHLKAAKDRASKDGVLEMWRRWEDEREFTQFTDLKDADIAPPPGGPDGWQRGYILGYMNAAFKEHTNFFLDDFTVSTQSLLDVEADGKEAKE